MKDRFARENVYLESELRSELHFEEIVGKSKALRHVLREIETVAPADSTVLIYGETGTGKELIARALHNLSSRKANAFVKLNCAAIPTGLLESELFGHERGAFTGAISQRVGRFELAHRGTIFLDEIGEIPLELQPKLLRVLQEREFERLGSARTLHSDARMIAATNRDLKAMVEDQKFRSDLYYRLNVFPIRVSALRERPEDIPLLVRHFVQEFSRRNNRMIETIPSEAMEMFVRYHWPGNIRELQNVIERAVIISKGPVLNVPLAELQPDMTKKTKAVKEPGRMNQESLQDRLDNTERTEILRALEAANGIDFVLACDMRFAARESAIFSQPEPALGVLPGGGASQHLARLMGRARALEVMLSAEDYDADLAERYGWINRALPAATLDRFVKALAHRIAGFPAGAQIAVKNRVNAITLAPVEDFRRDSNLFGEGVRAPEAQSQMQAAMKRGFQTRDAEMALGRMLGELAG